MKWMPGEIVKIIGPISYHVQLSTELMRRHVNNVSRRYSEEGTIEDDTLELPFVAVSEITLPTEDFLVSVPTKIGPEEPGTGTS